MFSKLSPALTTHDAEGRPRKYSTGALPFHPFGERTLVRPNKIMDKTEGGIILADESKTKSYSGRLLAAGLDAMDKLYDGGILIGDEVLTGKYSGVVEEWSHIVTEGKNKKCMHGEWRRADKPRELVKAYACESCGAERWVEEVNVINVEDILGSVEQAQRIFDGTCEVALTKNSEDGSTQHILKWKDR
jgi:co-chaperonin GroES (HSP10)